MSQLINSTKNVAKRILGKNNSERLKRAYMKIRGLDNAGLSLVDVCFINGCDRGAVPHPPRYRVTHQREQLEFYGVTTSEIFYGDVKTEDVYLANAFVVFRCPYTEAVGSLIIRAHELNKPVYFDVDDLVIDTDYTDKIPYVRSLDAASRALYDDGVNRMGKTLSMCDGAITTTAALAEELKKYVPDVKINRNSASEEMYKYSLDALSLKDENIKDDINIDEKRNIIIPKRSDDEIRIGYFSGSLTHNSDIGMIIQDLADVMSHYDNVVLYIVGELNLPRELERYSDRIKAFPFMDYRKLPSLIALVDINIAPLTDNIFNAAKSENKWIEAALVKTATVASNIGAFEESIENYDTGVLCKEKEWGKKLTELIENRKLRERIAENAFNEVTKNHITINNGKNLADFFKEKIKKTMLLALPSTEISGGILVALRHMNILSSCGWNISIVAFKPSKKEINFEGMTYYAFNMEEDRIFAHFEKATATLWNTVYFLLDKVHVKNIYYLVQGWEAGLYPVCSYERSRANASYSLDDPRLRYITISRWCQNWLQDKYGKNAMYAPNGLDILRFPFIKRNITEKINNNKKIRILIEGDSSSSTKKVDESFEITNKLDRNIFEIWYMAYSGRPKEWYHYDRFLPKVSHHEVGNVYNSCDILVKSSILESFSYPPLEMMATGGYVVAVQNDGNKEYLRDQYNCLIYKSGDIDSAVNAINEIVKNSYLRKKLEENGRRTAALRSMDNLAEDIKKLYEIQA